MGTLQHITDEGHIQNGGHSAALGRSTERGDTPKRGTLPRGQDGVHIQSGGHCQGIRTGGTLSYGGIPQRSRDGETLLDWGTQPG